MDGIISTKPDLCRRCYGCIRECPAKAIRVVNGQALVMQERCITCGHCVKVCSQGAKQVRSDPFDRILGDPNYFLNIAIVAPSFAASFPENYRKLPAALRAFGFEKVIETAFGADLISPLYLQDFQTGQVKTIISSSCPAVCNYIEKYAQELVPHLAPIVSPMIAIGKYIAEMEKQNRKESRVVFLGPCTAKKAEMLDEEYRGIIDAVLTFGELKTLLAENSISFDSFEDSVFDPPYAKTGKVFPLAGGLLKTAELPIDVMEKEIIVVEGKSKVLEIIEEIQQNKINARFVDILFCEGCISGPGIDSSLNYYSRREKVIEYIKESEGQVDKKVWKSNLYNSRNIDFRRTFSPVHIEEAAVDEDKLREVFDSINKYAASDKLNCSACGYATCDEFALWVAKGLAEREMCLPYLIDELQTAYENLREAQEQLSSAEKLASIGQLAAGIAHEINNPLGTIMLYASLVRKQLENVQLGNGSKEDLQIILNEANRCKTIVANLLNFARQGKLNLQEFDVFDLLTDLVKKVKPNTNFDGIKIEVNHDAKDTTIEADKDQLEQVFINILINAAEAMDGRPLKKIKIDILNEQQYLVVTISDTGCGIPKENQNKIFTPFFTTKKIGKGTGLGMAIVYGIIKMHQGDIRFESELERGTMFTITLHKALQK
jgi:signal transduction histidine kinase/iron only hydrogenase large subunit-like protein